MLGFSIWRHVRTPTDLEILFFDVGQGDASLIRFPEGTRWLVDAGGGWKDWDTAKSVLIPELARWGVLKLHGAVVSHTDLDHVFGFPSLQSRIPVAEFFVHPDVPAGKTEGAARLREAWKIRPTQVTSVESPVLLQRGETTARLFPLVRGKSPNDRALILSLDHGGCTVLFAGDVEKTGEAELVARHARRIHLLKVAHHGSKTSTSSEFLRVFRPLWTVISAGRGNHYGHPSESVLRRLRQRSITTLRTDFHGFVRFRISGQGRVRCDTFWGDCGESRCY